MKRCVFAVALLSVLSTAVVSLPCDEGWSFYQDGHKCIKLFEETQTWYNARSKCVDEGGRLLSIPDLKTQEFVNDLVGNSRQNEMWIGLTDSGKENKFVWSDGSIACSFLYWGTGEPNNLEDEDCVHLLTEPTHHWNDKSCGRVSPYICEKRGPGCEYKNGGCPGGCTDGTDGSWAVTCSCDPGFGEYDGKCYDLNECTDNNGGCDQLCENTLGSYQCNCHVDFVFNGTQCVIDEGDTLIG